MTVRGRLNNLFNWLAKLNERTTIQIIHQVLQKVSNIVFLISIATLINYFPIDDWTTMLKNTGLQTILDTLISAVTLIVLVYVVYAIVEKYCDKIHIKSQFLSGVTVFGYLLLCPQILMHIRLQMTISIGDYYSNIIPAHYSLLNYLGLGILVAVIMGLLITKYYQYKQSFSTKEYIKVAVITLLLPI